MLLKFMGTASNKKIAEGASDMTMYYMACTQYIPDIPLSKDPEKDYWAIRDRLTSYYLKRLGDLEFEEVKMAYGKTGIGYKIPANPLVTDILAAPPSELVPPLSFALKYDQNLSRLNALGMILGTKVSKREVIKHDTKTRLGTISNITGGSYNNGVLCGQLPASLYHAAKLYNLLCDMPEEDLPW